MSLNVAEGHFKYIIWSNEYLDWANWHEAFEEDYSNASDEKKYQLMSDLNTEYLEEERREMDILVGSAIIVIADIGDGTVHILGIEKSKAVVLKIACTQNWMV